MARPSPQTDRLVTLLEVLSAHPERAMTLAEITRRLGVHKSSCHAMVTSLTRAGWLLRDPTDKTYRLGPALAAVGRAAAEGFPALDFARPVMAELSDALQVHCAALGVAGDTVTVLHQLTDPRAAGPGLRVGTAYPLRPPFGSAVLAWADADAVAEWLAQVPDHRREHHRHALEATRRRGFAVEISATPIERVRRLLAGIGDADAGDGSGAAGSSALGAGIQELLDQVAVELSEREEYLAPALEEARPYQVNAINAPVFDHTGAVTLVVSLTGFAERCDGRRVAAIGARLVAATERITHALGGPGAAAAPVASPR